MSEHIKFRLYLQWLLMPIKVKPQPLEDDEIEFDKEVILQAIQKLLN